MPLRALGTIDSIGQSPVKLVDRFSSPVAMSLTARLSRTLFAVAYLASVYAGALHHHEHVHDGPCGHASVCSASQIASAGDHCGHFCSHHHSDHSHQSSTPEHGKSKHKHHGSDGSHDDCSICRSVGQLSLPVEKIALLLTPEHLDSVNQRLPVSSPPTLIRSHQSRAPPLLG
jgi:hypothetical protein